MQLGVLYEYWLVTIAALFVIVNPLTTAFMFLSMLPKASAEPAHKLPGVRSS